MFECNYLWITVPSIETLRQRLLERGTETPESLQKRVSKAETEMKMAEESGIFSKTLVNAEKEIFLEESLKYVKELYSL